MKRVRLPSTSQRGGAKVQLYFLPSSLWRGPSVGSLEKLDRYLLKFGTNSGLKSDTRLRNLMASPPLQCDQLGVQWSQQSRGSCAGIALPSTALSQRIHDCFPWTNCGLQWERHQTGACPNQGRQARDNGEGEFITHDSQYSPAGDPPKGPECGHRTASLLHRPDPESLKLPQDFRSETLWSPFPFPTHSSNSIWSSQ